MTRKQLVLDVNKGKFMAHRAKAFTLVEVVVSIMIVAATAAGIFASFIAVQSYVSRSRGRVNTSNALRQQIEALKAEVRQDTWNSTNLNITDIDNNNCVDDPGDWTAWAPVSGNFSEPPWNATFRRCVSGAGTGLPVVSGYREVQTQINWTEPGT